MAIEITKIKLSTNAREVHYKRFLAGGVECCQFAIDKADVHEIQEKMEPLLGEAIAIIGLDEERWNCAQVIGVSFKSDDDGTGVTISLMNKEDLAVCCNTPYLKPADQGLTLTRAIEALEKTAIRFINQQPKQMNLDLAIAS